MKKLIVIVLMSVMCLFMAFPASAADYELISRELQAFQKYKDYTNWGQYKYHLVLPSNTASGLIVLAFNTPDPVLRSPLMYYNFRNTLSTPIIEGPYYWSKAYLDSPSGDSYRFNMFSAAVGGTTKYQYFKCAAENLSTVNLPLYDTPSAMYKNVTNASIIDISALQSLILTAKNKTNTGYTGSTWQALQGAITAAESLLATTGYTQAQIDSAKDALQSALDGLQLLPDTVELVELLVEADQIEDIGYTALTWTRFDDARISGHALMARFDYTPIEVFETTTELQESMDGLELLPDISDLTALLADADLIENTGYTADSWNRFYNARFDGHFLISRPKYTQSEISAAVTELIHAMNGLELIPDTSGLVALLADADLIEDIGYTSGSWSQFYNARLAGHSLLSSTNYTQSDIDDAISELIHAMDELQIIPVDPPIDPPIDPPVYPPVDVPPNFYAIPPGSIPYLNIADGITPEHLEPAREAIWQNFTLARRYGWYIYAATLIPLIGVMIFRKTISIESDYSKNIDIHRPKTVLTPVGQFQKYQNLGDGDSKYD